MTTESATADVRGDPAVPGRVEAIHVTSEAGMPMRSVERVRAIAGVGLEGDRYATGTGRFSSGLGTGRALTLVEAEVIESLATDHGLVLPPGATRRNLTTRGIRLDDLLGRRFRIGDVECLAVRRAEPCAYLEGMLGREVLVPLVHRAGIRADILSDGEIAVGREIVPLHGTAREPPGDGLAGSRPRASSATVVFDLGGVLIDWNPRHLYRRLFDGDDAQMEWFLANVCSPAWNAGLDAGRPWDEAIRELVERFPEYADLIRAYRERFPEMLGGIYDENVAILAQLRARGTPLYALTNWSEETFDESRAGFPFLEWFIDVIVSGREGVAKPDERIFHALLERFELDPLTTVYLDDRPRTWIRRESSGLTRSTFS